MYDSVYIDVVFIIRGLWYSVKYCLLVRGDLCFIHKIQGNWTFKRYYFPETKVHFTHQNLPKVTYNDSVGVRIKINIHLLTHL